MSQHHHYKILGQNLAAAAWNGSPLTLNQYQSAAMSQTPNGSTVLAYQNKSPQNNDGTLVLTSGGSDPISLDAQSLMNVPNILVHNWGANNLSLTNVSANASTPIWVEMFGPGIPGGPTPTPIVNGTSLLLEPGATASGQTAPNYMQFILTSNTQNLTIVAVIGGPQDASKNNAYVFALNFPSTSSSVGYTKVTGGNSLTFPLNWGGASIYVANMSPNNAAPATINLISL